jgi:hypothetical protein
MSYTLDTNILIGMIQRYPRDIFPSIWAALEGSIDDGQACICQAVLEETDRAGDGLHDWAKGYPDFACDVTRPELELSAQISADHPDWVREQLNAADPFVIAHAKVDQRIIVTEENRKGPNTEDRNQKIPNVADEHDVDCIKFFEFARQLGWAF